MTAEGTLWGGSSPAPPHPLAGLLLRDYAPRRAVVVPESVVEHPKFPVIDAHNHLGTWLTGEWSADPGGLVAMMDELEIESIVNLDGRWGQELADNLDRLDRAHPGRFITFAQVDWGLLVREPGRGPELLAATFRASLDAGARGLKVWKDLGLTVRDDAGDLLLPDDPRLDDVFAIADDAGVPVAIHTADPVAFFDPLDRHNERLEQLLEVPEWSFADTSRFPRFTDLMASLEARVARHPGTVMIGVHMGCWAENLGEVRRMLRAYPNYHVDISARIAEIGRQPRAARALFEEFPDRVLFGTDTFPPDRDVYREHFRFLESSDECYDHDPDQPSPMGRWTISALELPDPILEAVYAGNARRLLT